MTRVPYTWTEMRARFEATMPLAACGSCRDVPDHSRDQGVPSGHASAELPEEDKNESWHRCTTCHRLYRWTYSPYEYIAWGSEDAYTTYGRIDLDVAFRSLATYRVADERFAAALAALDPSLDVQGRSVVDSGEDIAGHRVMQIRCGVRFLWIALSDEGAVEACTLESIARLARAAPPPDLRESWRAVRYLDFVDRVTSPYQRVTPIDAFDKIRWRDALTDEDRAYIEELRRASRVEPEQVEALEDRIVVRRWVVADRRLICRVLTAGRDGAVQREDAVVGELIPVA